MTCPHCQKEIPPETIAAHFASIGGRATSAAKAKAAKLNAKKGGWPKGKKRKQDAP